MKVEKKDVHTVPLQSLVYFRDNVGVYRYRDGWLKLIEVAILEKSDHSAHVRSFEISPGDQILTQGAPLVRAADLDVFSSEKEAP